MHIVIVGAGPAGEGAARTASKLKARVTLIEKENAGGLCLNRGCIPSKTWLSYAKILLKLGRSPEIFPVLPTIKIDIWRKMKSEKDRVIEKLRAQITKSLDLLKVEKISGTACFSSPTQIVVQSSDGSRKEISFDKAVIAVGSKALVFPPLDAFRNEILTSDTIWNLEEIPKEMVIVGGGAIGCEFACLFNALGTAVTLVEKMNQILPGEDAQIASSLKRSFEKQGITILISAVVQNAEYKNNRWELVLSDGKKLNPEKVLVCTGRAPDSASLCLQSAGIRMSAKGVETDSHLRTANPNVYAAGDVTGLSLFAHAGTYQGEIAVHNIFGGDKTFEREKIPRCLYTYPEAASIGISKTEAEALGIKVKSYRSFLEACGRAIAEDECEGYFQIVTDESDGRILGAQIIGAHATEIIHVFAVAIAQKMTRENLREIVFAHPSYSECIRSALER